MQAFQPTLVSASLSLRLSAKLGLQDTEAVLIHRELHRIRHDECCVFALDDSWSIYHIARPQRLVTVNCGWLVRFPAGPQYRPIAFPRSICVSSFQLLSRKLNLFR